MAHVTSETGLEYKADGGGVEDRDRRFLGAFERARLGAWSMRWRDSDIGDTPAA
jgi:hypothetical protein